MLFRRSLVVSAAVLSDAVAVGWGAGPTTGGGAAATRGASPGVRGGPAAGGTTRPKNAPAALAMSYAPLSARLSAVIKLALDQKNYGPLNSFPVTAAGENPPERDTQDGGILIGLRCGMNRYNGKDNLVAAQGVFLTPKGVVAGEIRGFPDLVVTDNSGQSRVTWVDLIAREGYAISGITLSGIGRTEGVKLHYLRMRDNGLDPTDGYDSPVAGQLNTTATGVAAPKTTSTLLPVVGTQSLPFASTSLTLGLLSVTMPEPKPVSALPASARGPLVPLDNAFAALVKTTIEKKGYPESKYMSGTNSPTFDDLAKDGGLLIGLRYGRKVLASNTQPIVSVQPIFLTAAGEVLGGVHGDPSIAPVDEVKAPHGYAVAGCLYGGPFMNYLELTYMKIGDRALVPLDAYKSSRIGGVEVNGGVDIATTFRGDGNPVIGISGKFEGNRLNIGLTYLRASGAETAIVRTTASPTTNPQGGTRGPTPAGTRP